jgi:hypothetical protein
MSSVEMSRLTATSVRDALAVPNLINVSDALAEENQPCTVGPQLGKDLSFPNQRIIIKLHKWLV